MCRGAVLLEQKIRPGPTGACLAVASGQEGCHDSVSIHFDTRLNKMDISAAEHQDADQHRD